MCRAGVVGLAGLFHGLAETSFEQQAHGILKDQPGAFALTALTVLPNPLRQAEGHRQRPHCHVKRQNDGDQRQNEQVQADLGPVGRKDEQDIAVVEARAEGGGNGKPEQDKNPEQALHLASLPLRRLLSAAWVSFSLGTSTTTSVVSSWRSVSCAA